MNFDDSPTSNDSEDNLLQLRPSSSGGGGVVEREHMFDKVVTPSDVGKLNRLVIPKQHAEKHFPLDSSTNEKGLLLNFEDRNGKPWRFRYSYWNSSQSYVMTKGWSRFVKEKKLDAGDIVSFGRGLGETGKDKLFIDWRRRPDAPDLFSVPPVYHFSSYNRSNWNPIFVNPIPSREYSQYYHNPSQNNFGYGTIVNGNPCLPDSIFYLRPVISEEGRGGILAPGGTIPQNHESVPVVVQGQAATQRLRLFGVNMDCPINSEFDISSNHIMTPQNYFLPASTSTTSTTTTFSPSALVANDSHMLRYEDEDKSMSLDLDM